MVALAGCAGGESVAPGESRSSLSPPAVDAAPAEGTSIPDAIDLRPTNGATFDGPIAGLAVEFAGFTPTPDQLVEVQVSSNARDPLVDANWVTIGSVRTDRAPTPFNDPSPVFRWRIHATPSPASGVPRWVQGGLIRYRSVSVDARGKRTPLPFFDASSSAACVARLRQRSWKEVVETCKSAFSPGFDGVTRPGRAAALVSTTTEHPRTGMLSRRGAGTEAVTAAYYGAIDAPPNLAAFKQRFGFPAAGPARDEAFAKYFNRGDLGIGRDIHCRPLTGPEGGAACYTKNFGRADDGRPFFSLDATRALEDAVASQNHFATVAMVKLGRTFTPAEGNDVRFYVFDETDTLALRAPLDNRGENPSIPQNCLNCHGGRFEEAATRVVGANFLPFDPAAFEFSTAPGMTRSAQEDQLRRLNLVVQASAPPPQVSVFVDSMYGGRAGVVGAAADTAFVPPGWNANPEDRALYRDVVRPYCQGCHMSLSGDYAFVSRPDLTREVARVADSVCRKFEMPVAEIPLERFLAGPARATLVNALGLSTPCAGQP